MPSSEPPAAGAPRAISPVTLELTGSPPGRFAGASDVAVDGDGNLLVLGRDPAGVFVYDPGGRYLRSWATPPLVWPHGITSSGDGGAVVVDQGAHAAYLVADGSVVATAGVPGEPSDTGCDWSLPRYPDRYRSIRRGGPPFNNPTKAARAPDGTWYVTDGYGNARVHHFSPGFELLASFGEPGSDPGQFRLPHSLCVLPDARVVVADRENERLQVFTPDGDLLEVWGGVQRPAAVTLAGDVLVVAEGAWRTGDHSFTHGDVAAARPGGVSVVELTGEVVARYRPGQEENQTWSPHGLAWDGADTCYLVDLAGRVPVVTDGERQSGLVTIRLGDLGEPTRRGGPPPR